MGEITVFVMEDHCKRITGFKAIITGTTYEVKVKDSILIAWQKLETIIDRHLGQQRQKGLALRSGRAPKSYGTS